MNTLSTPMYGHGWTNPGDDDWTDLIINFWNLNKGIFPSTNLHQSIAGDLKISKYLLPLLTKKLTVSYKKGKKDNF